MNQLETTGVQSMPDEVDTVGYLDSLGLGTPVRERIQVVLQAYESILSQPIEQIFVSETMGDGGQRLVESLWVITASLMCEAHNVLTEDFYDFAEQLNISHLFFQPHEFVPGNATPDSRLLVRYTTSIGLEGSMKASGSNCEVLFGMLHDRLVPRLVERAGVRRSDLEQAPAMREWRLVSQGIGEVATELQELRADVRQLSEGQVL